MFPYEILWKDYIRCPGNRPSLFRLYIVEIKPNKVNVSWLQIKSYTETFKIPWSIINVTMDLSLFSNNYSQTSLSWTQWNLWRQFSRYPRISRYQGYNTKWIKAWDFWITLISPWYWRYEISVFEILKTYCSKEKPWMCMYLRYERHKKVVSMQKSEFSSCQAIFTSTLLPFKQIECKLIIVFLQSLPANRCWIRQQPAFWQLTLTAAMF
jgi:hypothetical protein